MSATWVRLKGTAFRLVVLTAVVNNAPASPPRRRRAWLANHGATLTAGAGAGRDRPGYRAVTTCTTSFEVLGAKRTHASACAVRPPR
ncbi:hypothetical protein GCM10023074_20600 [Microbispora amethystogenes]|uniref:Secreted protein n=1 Tax=Microbispora amethystogenes TaxID=1427754 RepID=A0ABQ4FC68_9ACTN|nr:hypothetical protein Mam01_25610 [Microbispora amethystogenes]